MEIVFRVDATKEIGIGHLMRCLALSEELTNRRNNCYFLSIVDNELVKKIDKFNVKLLKQEKFANLKEDLDSLVRFCKQNRIDWIITDHYGLDQGYIKELKKNDFKVLSIDDLAKLYYYSDIVVNQNIGAKKLIFKSIKNTNFLLGPEYVILRDELLKRKEKNKNSEAKNILLTLGGTDNDNFTFEMLKTLKAVNDEINIIAVFGPLNPFYKKNLSNKKNLGKNVQLIHAPDNMADLYSKVDIAVSAGGSSCYELAYFGIPNIIITIAGNQINMSNELDKQKVSIYIGHKTDVKSKLIKSKIEELINDDSLRKKMSDNGKMMIDGKGKKRIVDFMESFS